MRLFALLLPLLSACASVRTAAPPKSPAPRVDYHEHLVSAAFAPRTIAGNVTRFAH
jgi:hypothetical protein